jgi:hypothetical protein
MVVYSMLIKAGIVHDRYRERWFNRGYNFNHSVNLLLQAAPGLNGCLIGARLDDAAQLLLDPDTSLVSTKANHSNPL